MYSAAQIDLNMSNYQKKSHVFIPNDLLNDLSSRFIINVPEEERVDLTRLCFQIELAHWFYLDFYLEENNTLPKVALKDFIHIIFRHIPFLQKYSDSEVDTVIADWREYKKAVPTFGAILLDQDLKHVLLVQSFTYKTSWGFPKGKVNKDEQPHHCAIREVLEETGFDISHLIDNDVYLEYNFNDQLIRLYIIPGVPLDENFQPKTRNEIKCCEWFLVNNLPVGRKDHAVKTNLSPNSFFMVIPFVKQLKKWISSKIAHAALEKQQQVFAQMTKNDYARFLENSSPSENRTTRQSKSIYSPPPRMLRQKNMKHSGDDKKKTFSNNQSEINEGVGMNSKPNRKPVSDSTKAEENGYPISKAWKNFSLDCEDLIITFNSSLRKSALKHGFS